MGYRLAPSADRRHTVLEIDEPNAATLRLAFDLIVNRGYSTVRAAEHLNTHGLRTVRGRPWRHPNLCFQLRQRHLTGRWVYRDSRGDVEVQIPAVFTIDEWERLQAAIKGRPRPQRKNRLYPLTGRGRCHLRCSCGAALHPMDGTGHP